MNLSISNIGWKIENDNCVYNMMKEKGFRGLEIAPTRIFPDKPYEKIDEASRWSRELFEQKGFVIPSMQSIWYGKSEMIFGTDSERKILLEYTKSAIDFASAIGCKNLVFGCPRNRNKPEGADEDIAVLFFKEIGDYAFSKKTVVGMEANPPIYNTNYINRTSEAIELIERVDSKGFKLNLDLGTVICLEESLEILDGKYNLINHVHISEPGLKPIERRDIHNVLRDKLHDNNYQGFVSIEMGTCDDLMIIEKSLDYISGIFEM